ncbi:putative acid trehalase [Xylariaceae sp. FL0804]|nr:putative acid trehalase [Xylariaceae sp. FL0804]
MRRAAAVACGARIYETRFDGTTWDDRNWRLTTTNLDQGHYQSRMTLANGYLGIAVAVAGPFFEVDTPVNGDMINGWPLFDRRQTFATVAGFYDEQPATNGTNFAWLAQYGGDSVISGVPHWAGLHVQVDDGEVLDASVPADQISGFSSTVDVGAGVMSWSYTWTPSEAPALEVEYSMFVHRLHVNQAAVQLRLSASRDVNVTVIDVLNGDCAVRTNLSDKGYEQASPVIWSAVSPWGLSNVTAYIYSTMLGDSHCHESSRREYTVESVIGHNSSSIAQAMDISLVAGQASAVVTKYIGGASSDAFEDPQSTALDASRRASQEGFANLLSSHLAEWGATLTKDSVDSYHYPENGSLPDDPNVVELQITAVTNPFQLLQQTVGANAIAAAGNNTKLDINSIPVAGLGSDSYGGQVFWDADAWMAPGLLVAHPLAARQIARYRVAKFPQAQRNIQTAYQSSQNETGKFSPAGAVYSWTSARYGNCTPSGPCFDYEYHINGDIGLNMYNYLAVSGDDALFLSDLFPVYDAIAQFYSDLVTYNDTSGRYELYNATDPDEYANYQTNVGYTMVLMKTHINTANALRGRYDMPVNETWANISSLINVPIDHSADIILEYQTMDGSILVKQADVVLVDDFLDYPNPYTLSDLDYYAGKQSPDGPGMTYGVFSVVANAVSPSGCSSYTYDLAGSQPYTRGPWFQLSEQLEDDYGTNGGTHPAFPFLTGVGGAHRVAVFGYLGLRPDLGSFRVDPSLPPQIPHLAYRTVYWQGWPVAAASNQTHTTLTRRAGAAPLRGANATFATAPIPVTVGGSSNTTAKSYLFLPPNGTITLTNRRPGSTQTVAGNMAQCRPVVDHEPGQFPLAAVDGARSTKWQPTRSNVSSSLTVRLAAPPFVPVAALHFDWAQSPPAGWSVTFSNSSSGGDDVDAVKVAGSSNVTISDAYVPADADAIVPYRSNSTNVSLLGGSGSGSGSPVWSGRWATLTITGNRATEGTADERNGTGATVAEWAIISLEGSEVAFQSSS